MVLIKNDTGGVSRLVENTQFLPVAVQHWTPEHAGSRLAAAAALGVESDCSHA